MQADLCIQVSSEKVQFEHLCVHWNNWPGFVRCGVLVPAARQGQPGAVCSQAARLLTPPRRDQVAGSVDHRVF